MFSVLSRAGKAGAILALSAAIFSPARSVADSFFYHFNNVFYGMTPTGVSPWVDVLFTDTAPGKVSVTVSTPGLVGNEYVAGLYLNLNPLVHRPGFEWRIRASVRFHRQGQIQGHW
jgi:hypothetical protein